MLTLFFNPSHVISQIIKISKQLSKNSFLTRLGCPVATDDHYEIIENMCFYFEDDFGVHDFASAQTACESKFPHGSGQLFEPKSLSHLQQVREAIQRRGMTMNYELNRIG